jgi:hypothetical protein
MKTLELNIRGIDLKVNFWQSHEDAFDHQDGHYTIPGKWRVDSVFHKDEDITELIEDYILYKMEKEANE